MSATIEYTPESLYAVTPIFGKFLGYYTHRPIRANKLDVIWTMDDGRYNQRPDLFAKDLYGSENLFWVMGLRNGLQDLVFDFKFGETFVISHPSFIESII